jgi:hypothetical protein
MSTLIPIICGIADIQNEENMPFFQEPVVQLLMLDQTSMTVPALSIFTTESR